MAGRLAFLIALVWSIGIMAAGERVVAVGNNVPLRATPSDAAAVLWRVNEGHPLIVEARDGDWLRVRAPHLPREPGVTLWVRAAQVSDMPSAMAEEETILLTVGGSAGIAFDGSCRLVDPGNAADQVEEIGGEVPGEFGFVAAAMSCSLRKVGVLGRLAARLHRGAELLAEAETTGAFGSVLVRSSGPWGAALGRSGPHRLVALPETLLEPTPTVPPLTPPVVPQFGGSPVPPLR